jgi:hypothetical protein
MGIGSAIGKGFSMAAKCILICLTAMAVFFVAMFLIGILMGVAIVASNFPPITPMMTQAEINALNWSQVRWGLLIPLLAVIALLAGIIMSFVQGGLVSSVKDCVKTGSARIGDFFSSGLKFLGGILLQYITVIVTASVLLALGAVIVTAVGLSNVTPLIAVVTIVMTVLFIALLVYLALALLYGQLALVSGGGRSLKALGSGAGFLNTHVGKSLGIFIPFALIFLVLYLIGQGLAGAFAALPIAVQFVLNFIVSFVQLLISFSMMGSFASAYFESAR